MYKGKWTANKGKDSKAVAVKTLRGGASQQDTDNFLMEASVMSQFRNPYVVHLYGIVSKVEPVMIIMEYMQNGSLDHYLRVSAKERWRKRRRKRERERERERESERERAQGRLQCYCYIG